MLFAIAIGLHTIAAAIWVGGMFFAHMALRPVLADMDPPARLALWAQVFPRFFKWVWLSILTLLVTGYGTLLTGYRGGLGGGALHVDVMQATGLLMMTLFAYLFFGPFQSFKRAVAKEEIQTAAASLARIRQIVTINLVLGLITVFIGAAGTFVGY